MGSYRLTGAEFLFGMIKNSSGDGFWCWLHKIINVLHAIELDS